MRVNKVYAIEISGACNLEAICVHCPMHNRPRSRKRGLMSDETIERAIHWVKKLGATDPLSLHNFGEPLLHPRFDEIAERFSKFSPITMSTNAVLLDETWADRLAKVNWAWISLSPWSPTSVEKARLLLEKRRVRLAFPPGVTHNFAGQAQGPSEKIFRGCPLLDNGTPTIRWDGSVASCCISDREEDVIGNVNQEPEEVKMRSYSICSTCHHAT